MNRDPVVFDEPHGYYGPAVVHHGDRTFDVTAELHTRAEEHGPLSWSGVLTARGEDGAAGALCQLRRDQFTLQVGDRRAQCAGTEVRLASNEPMQLRIVGIGPGPFRPADVVRVTYPATTTVTYEIADQRGEAGRMSGMDDRLAWLRARLDEDERRISAACAYSREAFAHGGGDSWTLGRDNSQPEATYQVIATLGGLRSKFTGITLPVLSHPVGQYLETFDPARMLREVEAKRKLLDLAVALTQTEGSDPATNLLMRQAGEDIIDRLAKPYADRAG